MSLFSKMTRHQETAYRLPCFYAEECQNRRFFWSQAVGGVTVSVGLTANTGLE